MPVYLVTVTEPQSGQRAFDYICEAPLEKGAVIRDEETKTTYKAVRVRHTPTGRYDGEVDADWGMGPPVTDRVT